MSLQKTVSIVTGGGKSLGKALSEAISQGIAQCFLEEGINVAIVKLQQNSGVSSQESEVKFALYLGLEFKRCTSLTCKLL
ncbi:MAG TPA: hypothetical protein V6D48_02395 [Oculatellaceae cyanobacterium]